MDITVSFPGGKRVDAQVGDLTVATDQPVELGGDGSAAAPFDLFLASIAACAGVYALGFCQARGLSTEGLGLVQRHTVDPDSHLVSRVTLELTLPVGFPEKYRAAIQRSVEGCKVKKNIVAAPVFDVVLTHLEDSCAVA